MLYFIFQIYFLLNLVTTHKNNLMFLFQSQQCRKQKKKKKENNPPHSPQFVLYKYLGANKLDTVKGMEDPSEAPEFNHIFEWGS